MASRARKGREAKFDAPGQVGRLTGTVMPTNVPLNEDGAEDFEAFFTSPKSQAVSTKSSSKKRKTPASSKEAKRRQARPDKAHQLGEVGRVTGKVIRGAPRNSDGVEDIDAFYKSPTEAGTTGKKSIAIESRRVSTMSMASSVGVARRESPSYRARRETEYGEQFDGQTLDMEVDDESGLSPRSYMQSKNASRSRQSGVTTFSASPPLIASKSRPSTNTLTTFSDVDEPEQHHTGDLSAISQLPSSPAYSEDNEPLPGGPPSPPLPNNEQLMQELDGFDNDFAGPPDLGEEEEEEGDGGLEMIQEEDEEEIAPLEDKENKKGKGKASTVSPKGKQVKKKRKWESEEPEGVRKSTRRKMEPLEYWRNERIVYARRDSGPQPHYGIKEVLHPKKAEHKSLVSKKRSASRAKSVKEEAEEGVNGDFEGWDDATDPEGLVWDYVKHEETKRRIAFTSKMIATKTAGKQSFRFQKVFTDGDFMAGGILEIPVNEKKPLKPARDNSYILYVVKGAVRALVYRTTFTIAKGGFFLVPRGNSYEIENIGSTDAQIIFLQGREIRVTEEVGPEE